MEERASFTRARPRLRDTKDQVSTLGAVAKALTATGTAGLWDRRLQLRGEGLEASGKEGAHENALGTQEVGGHVPEQGQCPVRAERLLSPRSGKQCP